MDLIATVDAPFEVNVKSVAARPKLGVDGFHSLLFFPSFDKANVVEAKYWWMGWSQSA